MQMNTHRPRIIRPTVRPRAIPCGQLVPIARSQVRRKTKSSEPTRSISEVRTIVSGKDRLDTLTYVNNEYGFVDPVTGEIGDFAREPIQVNIFGYPSVLGDLVANVPTISQPVYIGNRDDTRYRYSITSRGSDTPAGAQDWDGNVPFYWEPEDREYRSKPFTKFFSTMSVQTKNQSTGGEVGTGPHLNTYIQVVSTASAAVGGQAGVHIGNVTLNANSLHVHGAAGFRFDQLAIAANHPNAVPIAPTAFKVVFPAWSTQVAQNGYCVLSRAPNDIVFAANLAIDKLAYSLVPDLPVEVFTPNFKVRGTPPGFRIAGWSVCDSWARSRQGANRCGRRRDAWQLPRLCSRYFAYQQLSTRGSALTYTPPAGALRSRRGL